MANAFEDQVRLAIHDILVHLHKTWDSFCEAAAAKDVTPEQAEASLLAEAVMEIKEDTGSDDEKIGKYLKTCYVLWALGLLPKALEKRLEQMMHEVKSGSWKEAVGGDLGIDAEMIRRINMTLSKV